MYQQVLLEEFESELRGNIVIEGLLVVILSIAKDLVFEFILKYPILPFTPTKTNVILTSFIKRMNKAKENKRMKFFSPTSELKELLLLQHIEEKPDTTQKEIASVISGAASMVNVYIDNLEERGYLERDYKSAKLVYYNITAEGIKRKNYLLISYMGELLDLYKLAKENVEKFLKDLEEKGYKNILLYGAGEVAETILSVIRDKETDSSKVLAVIDDDIHKKDGELLGHRVILPQDIKNYDHDAIVITSYTFEDEILMRLEELGYPEERVTRFFSE